MPVLNAASIDYSLLAGAESLAGDGHESETLRQRRRGTASEEEGVFGRTDEASMSSSNSSASSPPTSDDEEEVHKARKAQQDEEEAEKSKYAFRTPKKVISQVCRDWMCWVPLDYPQANLQLVLSIYRTQTTGCGCTTKSRIDLADEQS